MSLLKAARDPRPHALASCMLLVAGSSLVLLLGCSHERPPSPPSTGWTHQPPGFSVLADWPFDALTGSGRSIRN